MSFFRKSFVVFALKFIVIAPIVWVLWWWMVPQYAWLIGQVSGMVISVGGTKIEALRVASEDSFFLNAETTLIFVSEGREYPFDVASLVSNLPPLIILVLATPAVSGRRIVRAFAIGIPVLTLGHVAFITAAFLLRDQIRNQPEIPTGVGYVLLTLPFVLWILLIHWETIAKLLPLPEDSSPPET